VRCLLDVNVLVGLSFPEHTLHARAYGWFHKLTARPWASCPLTQAGYLRVAYQLLGGTHASLAQALGGLEQTCGKSDHVFWSLDVDLTELSSREGSKLIGSGQVTDMQLLMLAYSKQAQLVTADAGIRELARGTRFEDSLLVL